MTAINHALTGALLGLTISSPIIALPLAVASHFVCDALPHFGSSRPDEVFLKTATFKIMLVADALLCVGLVLVLFTFQPQHWLLASFCAFLATSPDLLWINNYLSAQRQTGVSYQNWFLHFAYKIQWFAKPIGGLVELVWFGAGSVLVSSFLH